MKTLSAVKYAVGASVVALALTACTKNEEPNNAQEADIVVAELVIQEIQAVCDEPSLRNRLVDSLQVGLLDSALLEVQGYDDATRLGLEQQVRQSSLAWTSICRMSLHRVRRAVLTCILHCQLKTSLMPTAHLRIMV